MGGAIIDYHNNLFSLYFELTIKLVQPFLKKCPIHPCFFFEINICKEGYKCAWSILEWQIFQSQTLGSSQQVLDAAIPVNCTLPFFPPEQYLPQKFKDFDGIKNIF